MAEQIYRNLVCSIDGNALESVHLCDFPVVNDAWIDPELEANMDEVLKVVVMGRAARNAANIKNRQPIGKMYVKAEYALDKFFVDIIAEELNVKEVVFADDVSAYTDYTFKPQLKTVGPKYGKLLGRIQAELKELNGNEAMNNLRTDGYITLCDGEAKLAEEDLLITMTQMEGYQTESDNTCTVVLDCNMTPELIDEGFVRELVSKIQTMRKEADFEVMDKIDIAYEAEGKVDEIFTKYAADICHDVLGESIVKGNLDGYRKDWNINGESVVLTVKRK